MKLSIKKLSTIAFAFLLAVGAGAMLGVENKAEVNQAEAASTDKWSMIGTPNWDTDTSFTYDSVNKFYGQDNAGRFTLTYTFEANNEFKMRKDNKWDVSIGYGGQKGQGIGSYLSQSGENFKVNAAGSYLLTLHTDVATYDDKSYGFAIAKPYNITIKDGDVDLKTLYYEDYNNAGYTISYSSVTKTGYTLEGLYSDSNLTQRINDNSILTNQTMTLYSKWTKVYSQGRYITGKFGDCNWDVEHSVIMPNDGTQFVGTVDLELGDTLKIAWYDGTKFEGSSYVGYSKIIDSAEAKFCFSGDKENDNIICWAAGTYTFYFGFNDRADNNSISVTYASTNAEILAAKIMSLGEYEGHCGDDDRFPAMRTMYLGLDASEQSKFQGFETSETAQFKNAYDRYVAWARALGKKPWEDGEVNATALSLLGINESNSSTAIIVVIAALLTVGLCAGYAFYRKKKHA